MLKLIWPDPQIPFHHRKATAALCNMLADRGEVLFDEIHQIGDLFDMTALSRWVRGGPGEDGRQLQKELDAGVEWLENISKVVRWDTPRTMVMGNHDDRLKNYTGSTAKGLHGLRALEFGLLTHVEDYGWEIQKQPYRITHDTVSVHGLTVRSKSGYTAHAHIDKFFPVNVIHGHTHRAGIVYRTIGAKTSWAMECGNTMDRGKADYCLNPDWQMGFSVLVAEKGEPTVPMFFPMKNDGSFWFDGRRWTA